MSKKSVLAFGLSTLSLSWMFVVNPAIADSLPDPTRPGIVLSPLATEEKEGQANLLTLQAILFADGRRIAIINDQRLLEGEVIQFARVVSIERDRVRLTRAGQNIDLALIARNVKSAPQPAAAADESTPIATTEGTER